MLGTAPVPAASLQGPSPTNQQITLTSVSFSSRSSCEMWAFTWLSLLMRYSISFESFSCQNKMAKWQNKKDFPPKLTTSTGGHPASVRFILLQGWQPANSYRRQHCRALLDKSGWARRETRWLFWAKQGAHARYSDLSWLTPSQTSGAWRTLLQLTKKPCYWLIHFSKHLLEKLEVWSTILCTSPFERVLIGTGAALQTGKEAKVQKAGRFGLPPATSSLFLFFPLCPLSSFLPLSFLFLPFSFLWTRGKRKGRREGSWNNSLITRYCLHIFLVVLGLGNQ